jgi:hypothetical protein
MLFLITFKDYSSRRIKAALLLDLDWMAPRAAAPWLFFATLKRRDFI